MSAVRIRRAMPDDVPALAALKRRTFRETFLEDFAIPYPPADIAIFEELHYREEAVRQELEAPDRITWLGVTGEDMLAGYCHVGPCKLPHPDVRPGDGEIGQLYLAREWQGAGLGRRLMAEALDWLDAHSPDRQWVGVWSGNDRAQSFYAAFGFRKVGEYDFAVGSHLDREFILRRP